MSRKTERSCASCNTHVTETEKILCGYRIPHEEQHHGNDQCHDTVCQHMCKDADVTSPCPGPQKDNYYNYLQHHP